VPGSIAGIDAEIVRISKELARRDLELGRGLLELSAGRRWVRLGFRSLAAYARERLGLSLSSVEHRMTLARAAARHPALEEALASGEIGYEAGLLVAQVLGRSADEDMARAWVERAGRRTIKHLREEVRAVKKAAPFAPDVSRMPPGDEDIAAVRDLEAEVLSGEPLRRCLNAADAGAEASTTVAADASPQTSRIGAADPHTQTPPTLVAPTHLGAACSELSLRISRDLLQYGARVEAEFRSWVRSSEGGDAGASFVGFLCVCFWQTWLPFLEAFDDRWKSVYRRDLHQCQSPVCQRRDVTPHHLAFRAYGGSDDDDNLITLCSWCHLQGVHGGRLEALGPADQVTWRLGRVPWLEVTGRERSA
jgi:hypothetical protein